ncbi:MAG: NAD-dependent epimerase/dehydratase family protein [Dehalococcoidia bacterium]
MKILVTGAGGFIGHHLVKRLKADGHWVRGVDIKYPEYEPSTADEFVIADLRFFESCATATADIDDVYNLAADMGGIGYITANHATLTRNNILINAHMLEGARLAGVERYLYTSSACVYPSFLQHEEDVTPLKEQDAVPADPEKGYGWEKLFAEELSTYYHEDHGLDVRIVRFHNIYGPLGTYEGGKEKAPAAIMRKVSEAADESTIEVWGDGEQTRSFCYVDDCVEGLIKIMESGFTRPINLGTDEMVTVNQLVDAVTDVADKQISKRHDLSKPQGVRGRNSDNSLLREIIGWEPQIKLREGIQRTYPWIWEQLSQQGRATEPVPGGLVSSKR